MEELKDIGKRIERVKSHFNYSNGQLGEVCGVSYTAIAKIISGTTKDPSVSIFINLAEKLKININWLLFNQEDIFSTNGTTNSPDQEKEMFKILLHSKEMENETLKKMVNMLEEKLDEYKSTRKKVS
jgi:transcriptional regulator with XRE-family HTH domain